MYLKRAIHVEDMFMNHFHTHVIDNLIYSAPAFDKIINKKTVNGNVTQISLSYE